MKRFLTFLVTFGAGVLATVATIYWWMNFRRVAQPANTETSISQTDDIAANHDAIRELSSIAQRFGSQSETDFNREIIGILRDSDNRDDDHRVITANESSTLATADPATFDVLRFSIGPRIASSVHEGSAGQMGCILIANNPEYFPADKQFQSQLATELRTPDDVISARILAQKVNEVLMRCRTTFANDRDPYADYPNISDLTIADAVQQAFRYGIGSDQHAIMDSKTTVPILSTSEARVLMSLDALMHQAWGIQTIWNHERDKYANVFNDVDIRNGVIPKISDDSLNTVIEEAENERQELKVYYRKAAPAKVGQVDADYDAYEDLFRLLARKPPLHSSSAMLFNRASSPNNVLGEKPILNSSLESLPQTIPSGSRYAVANVADSLVVSAVSTPYAKRNDSKNSRA